MKSLTLDQAVAVITAARTLPVMELRSGLKDVRRPAELMHAYIVLSLLTGIRTEEARALRLGAHRPGRRPRGPPSRAAARGRVAVGPRARRHQDRAVPPHPRPPPGSGPGAARLVGQPPPASGSQPGDGWRGHRAGVHQPSGRRAGRGQRPQMFERIVRQPPIHDWRRYVRPKPACLVAPPQPASSALLGQRSNPDAVKRAGHDRSVGRLQGAADGMDASWRRPSVELSFL